MSVLLVSPDLMIQSRVAAAASRAGLPSPRVISWQDIPTLEGVDSYRLLIVDLASPGMDIDQTIAALRERRDESAPIIAFAPHVHTAKLAVAREAGCDQVLSRGQFDREIEAMVQRLADR